MRIWSKQSFAEINRQNEKFLKGYLTQAYTPSSTFQIGIVGGGPKGAYAIERLASIWKANLPKENLRIICFNIDTFFGSGPNYLPEQPDYLLINYSLGNVNFWTDEIEQLVDERDTLLDFMQKYQEGDNRIVAPEDFCSRALTGIYLQHCLCQVISALPETIQVELVPHAVNFIEKSDGKINLFSKIGKLYSFSEVILCTGHRYTFQDELTRQITNMTSCSDKLTYVNHIYPITQLNNSEFSGKKVLIQGLGLTFVDAVLALTEGQGGKFVLNKNELTYIPSGMEPEKIYPYSRSGLPMLARNGGAMCDIKLKFFTNLFADNLLKYDRKLDFEEEIYPFIEKEYRFQFARMLLIQIGYLSDKDALSCELETIETLAQTAIPDFVPFDLENFLTPKLKEEDHHEAVVSYITQSLASDILPIEDQITNEMTAVWRAIYPHFRQLYNFGRLTGKSQQQVDEKYFGRFQRVSYGPPFWNMLKIKALATAGFIRFDIGPSPTLNLNYNGDKFEIWSKGKLMKYIESNILINARIAKSGNLSTHPKLYQNLHKTYGTELFQNESYRPGCFKLNEEGALAHLEEITLNGTPTEGWTLDNESLSRSNNNFISPWATKLVKKYVIRKPQINSYSPSMD